MNFSGGKIIFFLNINTYIVLSPNTLALSTLLYGFFTEAGTIREIGEMSN